MKRTPTNFTIKTRAAKDPNQLHEAAALGQINPVGCQICGPNFNYVHGRNPGLARAEFNQLRLQNATALEDLFSAGPGTCILKDIQRCLQPEPDTKPEHALQTLIDKFLASNI